MDGLFAVEINGRGGFCRSRGRRRRKTKKYENHMPRIGSHAAKITNATAIQPRPEVLPSTQPGSVTRLIDAPANPLIAPPKITYVYRMRYTLMPSESAAEGYSPTERRLSPGLVRLT